MTHASITYYNTFFSFSRLGATTYLEAELQYNSDKKGPRQNFACCFEFSCTATGTKNSKLWHKLHKGFCLGLDPHFYEYSIVILPLHIWCKYYCDAPWAKYWHKITKKIDGMYVGIWFISLLSTNKVYFVYWNQRNVEILINNSKNLLNVWIRKITLKNLLHICILQGIHEW